MRKKRWLLAVTLFSLTALFGAACAQEEGGGDDTDDQAAAECSTDNLQALGSTGLPSASDFKLAKAVQKPRLLGQAKKTVKLGFLGDLTGGNAGLVTSAFKSAQLAIKEANEKGDLEVTVEISEQNNEDGDENTAPALAQKPVADPAVIGVIGPAFSGETKTTGELFQDAGLTHITQSATGPDLTKNGWKTFFRALATDAVQGGQTGPFIVDALGCEKLAIVNDKSEYGAGLAKAVVDSVEEAGGEVVLDQGIEPTSDYSSIVNSVIAKDPDVVYYSGYDKDAPLFVKQYRDKGGEALVMGGDGDKGTNLLKEGGEAVEGMVLTCPCLDPNASEDEAPQAFAKAYKEEYDGEEASIYSSEAYDVANIFIAAIKDAGANPTRASILEYVTNLKDFKGLSKTFNWTEEHEVVGGEITYVYEVEDGKYTLLGEAAELAKE